MVYEVLVKDLIMKMKVKLSDNHQSKHLALSSEKIVTGHLIDGLLLTLLELRLRRFGWNLCM